MLEHVQLGILSVFGGPDLFGIPLNIIMVSAGLFAGILVGATPGMAGPIAMAVSLPILISVFGYESGALLPTLGFLLGVMKGATVGGAVPAILFKTPGTPDAMLTTLDGYPMTRNGYGRKALRTAHFSSVSGDTISDMVLFICAPSLAILVEAHLDLPEKAALILLSLCFIAAVMGKPLSKGLVAVGAGLFVATIGTGEGFYPRLSLETEILSGGFPIATVILGVLVISEILSTIDRMHGERRQTGSITQIHQNRDDSLSLKERIRLIPFIATSASIGTIVGALPGIGSTMAATVGYTAGSRRHQKTRTPESLEFGKGAIEGVASTEAANSAVSGSNLIPVLSLGIPGNAAAIFLILAMETIDGINPGPGVFKVPSDGINPEMVLAFGVFTLMVFANLLNWMIGYPVMRLMALMIRVPKQILMPTVLLITLLAIYAQETSFEAIVFMMVFGILGYVMNRTGFSILPFVIAFILAGPLESTARQAFSATGGNPWFLFSSPIAAGLMLSCVVVVVYFSRTRIIHHVP